MSALWQIFALILREQRVSMSRGALFGVIVLGMGAALLGLSGWFITAAAAAGLAGVGAMFDVFRPSAMVRFLALGRASARYGERVLTHDATLRALQSLRVSVLRGVMAARYDRLIRLRGAQALNRLTLDVDTLDGVSLRLVLPVLAGLCAQLIAFAALWWLVGLPIALWIFLGFSLGAGLVFWATLRKTASLSRRTQAASHAFRARFIDLIRARRDLAAYGQMTAQVDLTLKAESRRLALRRHQDRVERLSGAAIQIIAAVVSAGTLWLGITLAQSGTIGPPLAALAFFTTLALAETIVPMRRAAGDIGGMMEAARRMLPDIAPTPVSLAPVSPAPVSDAPVNTDDAPCEGALLLQSVTVHRAGTSDILLNAVSLTVKAGETVALTGPSGIGKSTLLLAIAALHPIAQGRIFLGETSVLDCAEDRLRGSVALLPQRSAVMSGSVRDALHLGAAQCDDTALWQVLEAVQLAATMRARHGLDTRIGARGDGLSGGEARRLTLARAMLRHPNVLLLDEPTEGLDDPTALMVLQGVREFLPSAALLIAAHRRVEIECADRVLTLD
ncbi:amino acid ABC transporter ATP-binding/permease protein [Celeribacter marinus]|uniref:Transport ATP-binding protein CydC n=1 Tax=Celeribacter marinus TaxID=1397108 RepID=A0A0N9ZDL6_9RHOB|nr:ATP-binding cassette domain-containing protein [Celeribacter marinus]ALI54348.1 transport ATP-binding protein CydC [Celeribacter marinus]SFK36182.1 ATP-binding cassette, subfamily C, CydC [Celeribacter marinus]